MRTLSAAALKEIFASSSGAAFFVTLAISHADMTTVYYVNNKTDIVFGGVTYTAFAFKFTPPKESENINQTGKLVLANIDREFTAIIRSVATPPSVDAALLMVAADGTTTQIMSWGQFVFKNISYDIMAMSGDLTYSIELGNNVSMIKYNNINFPGIYA